MGELRFSGCGLHHGCKFSHRGHIYVFKTNNNHFLRLQLSLSLERRCGGNPRNVRSISQVEVAVNGGEHFLNI